MEFSLRRQRSQVRILSGAPFFVCGLPPANPTRVQFNFKEIEGTPRKVYL